MTLPSLRLTRRGRGLERSPRDAKLGEVICTEYRYNSDTISSVPTAIPTIDEFFAQPSIPEPIIYHVAVPRGIRPDADDVTLQDLLVRNTPLSAGMLHDLCRFGAVYATVNHLTPAISPRPPRIGEAVMLQNIPPNVPIYVRIHATPRRHRSLWPMSLLYDKDDLVIVTKPAGLPSVPTIDNKRECAVVEAESILRIANGDSVQLRVTSRLDVGTSGILVLARTHAAANSFNEALRRCEVRKYYAVLSKNPPSRGRLRHWINRKASKGQGPLKQAIVREWDSVRTCEDGSSVVTGDAWCKAELVVESVTPVQGGKAWESEVQLVSGRTHQIRLQYAAEGYHVWGCSKYANVGGNGRIDAGEVLADNSEKHGIHCKKLEFQYNGQHISLCDDSIWWHHRLDCD